MEKKYQVNIKCIFCDSTEFKIPYEGYQPEEGEMVECANCGKLNDFSSIRDFNVKETIEEEIAPEATEWAKEELKKIFKNSGFTIS